MHPVHPVQDWDDPEGAINWPRLASFLKQVKEEGIIPTSHKSHDALNKQVSRTLILCSLNGRNYWTIQKEVPIPQDILHKWTSIFDTIKEKATEEGVELIWGLVDGFLLYWYPVFATVSFQILF
jgi:nicotinamide/nicotinate riboside kinase